MLQIVSVDIFFLIVWIVRLGIGSLVLEQAESLRTSGTSLTLFKNGWRVLDALGVGDDLRNQFLEVQGYGHVHNFLLQALTSQ